MNKEIPILPFDAIPYLVRQRTRLQRMVSREYFQIMQEEFKGFSDYLPENANSVLGIGAGLGGMEIQVFRHFGRPVNIHILDRVGMDAEMKFGFRQQTEKYNDPDLARSLLESAGIEPSQINLWNADEPDEVARLAELGNRIDVILSIKSWCFHYPYSVYRDLVRTLLSPDGVMVLDVRESEGQLEEIERDFRVVSSAPTGGPNAQQYVFAHKE